MTQLKIHKRIVSTNSEENIKIFILRKRSAHTIFPNNTRLLGSLGLQESNIKDVKGSTTKQRGVKAKKKYLNSKNA